MAILTQWILFWVLSQYHMLKTFAVEAQEVNSGNIKLKG